MFTPLDPGVDEDMIAEDTTHVIVGCTDVPAATRYELADVGTALCWIEGKPYDYAIVGQYPDEASAEAAFAASYTRCPSCSCGVDHDRMVDVTGDRICANCAFDRAKAPSAQAAHVPVLDAPVQVEVRVGVGAYVLYSRVTRPTEPAGYVLMVESGDGKAYRALPGLLGHDALPDPVRRRFERLDDASRPLSVD